MNRGSLLFVLLLGTIPCINAKVLSFENDELKVYFTEKGEAFIESSMAHLCIKLDLLEFYNQAKDLILDWNTFDAKPQFSSSYHRFYR